MELNPVPPNASEMMGLFALVRGPVYSLTPPPAFHSLCRSVNVSRLPGRPVKLEQSIFSRERKVSREQSREMKERN